MHGVPGTIRVTTRTRHGRTQSYNAKFEGAVPYVRRRFGEAETGHRTADFLNDGDLVRAAFNEDDIKFGLFFCFFFILADMKR